MVGVGKRVGFDVNVEGKIGKIIVKCKGLLLFLLLCARTFLFNTLFAESLQME